MAPHPKKLKTLRTESRPGAPVTRKVSVSRVGFCYPLKTLRMNTKTGILLAWAGLALLAAAVLWIDGGAGGFLRALGH